MTIWQIPKVAALVAFVISCSMANEEPPRPEFVSEVIVKFSQGQQINSAIVASIEKGGELSTDINAYAASLSDQLGVPFAASRITSGNELVLEIRSDALLADLASHVAEHPDVADSRRTSDARSTPYRRDEVLISFDPDSDTFNTIAELDAANGTPSPEILELAAWLTSDLNYLVKPRLLPSGELALSVDTNALTVQLVEALQKREDVVYAQPNFVMKYD